MSMLPNMTSALWVVAMMAGACAATPLGASEAGLASARQRSPRGAEIFKRECSPCHGKRGEGLSSAPTIIGGTALPTYARDPSTSRAATLQTQTEADQLRPPGEQTRQPFRTAQDVFDFISKWMPLPKARMGTLPPEQYWDVVNFMLIAHGSAVPQEGITAQNAGGVPVPPP
jgi:Cytochrome c